MPCALPPGRSARTTRLPPPGGRTYALGALGTSIREVGMPHTLLAALLPLVRCSPLCFLENSNLVRIFQKKTVFS